MDVIRAIEDYSYYQRITGKSLEEWKVWRVAAIEEWGLDPDKVKGGEGTVAAGRDMELKVILDKLANCCRKHGIQSATATVMATGSGYIYGWDGTEKIYVSGQYEPYMELHKNETPAGGAAGESR